MRDRADAMDGLIQAGLLQDPTERGDSSTRQIAALRDTQAIEDELASMKARLQLDAPAPRPGLPAPEAEKP